ncbi:MAG: hypothetical protein ACTSWI_03595 [Alphaproteobacteria bacterium]
MVKPNTTAAAKAEKRPLFPYALTGLAVILLSAFLITQAAAQKDPAPAGGGAEAANIAADALDYCAWIAEDSIAAEGGLVEDGWTVDYSESSGPFVWEINTSKIYPDGTDAYIFALIESYPTGQVTYCSYDATGISVLPDLYAFGDIFEVEGVVEDLGGGVVYGTWEDIYDDVFYFVLANTDIDYFFAQMTIISAGGISDGTPDAAAGGGK